MERRWCVSSPVGPLTLEEAEETIVALRFGGRPGEGEETALLREAARQLEAYFQGERRSFDLPVKTHGTPFQESVWRALLDIPWGQTRTYGDIARAVGRPKAFRAVGMANHVNPVSIIVPCHRVVGADGSLTGYGGGIAVKRALLALEGIILPGPGK